MQNIVMPLCVALLSTAVNAQELSEDQWFEVSAVGFHHHGNPDAVALEQEDIETLFVKQRPFLSESFRKERLSAMLEKSKVQEFKPKRSVPLKDPRCFAEASRINKKEVYIKILKPLGAWRWHHHFQCLAMYKTQRNKTIDDIFALDKLYAKLSFSFQGIGHGMAGANIRSKDSAITKVLGAPDYEYPSQSPSLGRYYYKKHDLHVVTHEFVVYYVEKGKPDWVAYVKKERESLLPATKSDQLGATRSSTSENIRLLHQFNVQPDTICFSADSQAIAGANGKTVSIWNIESGRRIRELKGHTIPVTVVALSPDGKLLASVGCTTTQPGDLELKLWDLETGKAIRNIYEKDHDAENSNPFITFSPDGKLIAFPAGNRHVTVRNVFDWSEKQKLKISLTPAAGAFSFDNKLLAVGTADGRHGRVSLYDLANGRRIRIVSTVYESVRQVSFSADGRSIYAMYDGSLFRQDTDAPASAHPEKDTIWNWHRSELPRMKRPFATSYSVSNHLLALRSVEAESFTLYDTTTKKNCGTIANSKFPDLFSPNGKILATGDGSGKANLWAIETAPESTDRQLKELGAEENVSSNELVVGEWDARLDSDNPIHVTFNPDGTFELVNVDPKNQQRIQVRATGNFKIDFTVSPAHLDLQTIIRKPKHDDPVSQTLELILHMESLHSFRMSDLGSPERPKAFGEKAVIFVRRVPHLSTPTVAIQFYKTAVAAGDWKMAQECLSSDLQESLKEAIANRTFFDQYLVDDFANKTLELIPGRNTTSEDLDELRRDNRLRRPEAKRITAQVGHGGERVPWIAECTFVREQHGWRLTTDRIKNKQDFAAWYRKSIAESDQGKARDREMINDKLQIALVLNAQGRLEQTGATMKLAVKNNSKKDINLSALMQSSVLILNGQEFRLHKAFHDQWKNTMAITSGGSVEVTLPTAWYGIGSDFVASHYPEHKIEWQDKLYLGKHAVAWRVEGGVSNVTQFEMMPDG